MGIFGKIKNTISEKREQRKEIKLHKKLADRKVRGIYEENKLKGRIARAKSEGYKAGRTGQGGRRISIRTDGPDPFGFFGPSTRSITSTTKRRKRSGHTTVIIRNGGTTRRKKRRNSGSYLDQLL